MSHVTEGPNDRSIFSPPPRTVKPRSRSYPSMPVVALAGHECLDEAGQLSPRTNLLATLPEYAPTLFVTLGAADVLAELDQFFKLQYPTTWQWRTSNCERDIVRPDGKRVARRITVAVHYFGWKGGNYHKIIDPVTMYGTRLETVWPEPGDLIVKLLRWGITLRDFCQENGIDVRPTIGGISSQFLRDFRFYPHARRKVPSATNEQVREHLPGNHYALTVEPDREEFTAHYLDQTRAHHYHARTTPLPDSNHLYAYGRFSDLAEPVFTNTVDGFYGLYCLDLKFTGAPPKLREFHWLGKTVGRLERRFVYSNELPHLREMGFEVTGVRAAWGSRHRDTGLARYAAWCEGQLDRFHEPAWLKPLLLATYGTLAIRSQHAEAIFRLARSGEETTLYTGKHTLTGQLTRGRKKLEPGIANVLHRGMIEAATRSESIGLAQWLHWQGYHVLSIYADAVIVEHDDDHPLPLLPEPWRSKQTLNHLRFINQQAFRSGEMTKLPGVGRLRWDTLRPPVPSLITDVALEMEFAEGSFVRMPTHSTN